MNSTLNKVVNLYKPIGPTSFDLVRRVQNRFSARKAGHIGTLDPLAEGVLPVCINGATRIIQFLTRLPKVYLAEMKLGVATDTQDSEGKELETRPWEGVGEAEVKRALATLRERKTQVPPMFSAKKKNGVPLYKLARNGITVNREPVSIQIYSLEFISREEDRVTFRVHCSAGTYVRTLCHDAGELLGCGAHMTRLTRERVGPFDRASAITPEHMDDAWEDGTLPDKLLEPDHALNFLPEIRICEMGVRAVSHGRPITKALLEQVPDEMTPGKFYRVTRPESGLLAIAEPLLDNEGFSRLDPGQVAFKLKRVFIEP